MEVDQPTRADARRNRRRLLDAAAELILEIGGEPPRDAIAQRAGVGIATLYRHFPDQQALLHAVSLDVLDRTIATGEAALTDGVDGADVLSRYMHAAVDIGLGALNIIHPLLDSADWPDRRAKAQALLERIVDRATRDGGVAADTTPADIAFAVIRFCRPLAIGLSAADERSVAHRQIDTYLSGLAAHSPTASSDGSARAGTGHFAE